MPDGDVVASTVDAFGRVIALYADGNLLVDGTSCGRVTEPGRYPMIDAVGDGFVLVDSRCRIRSGFEAPRNGRILDAAGRTVTEFHAGDGIEAVVTGPGGDIWISYFDEASIFDGGERRAHPGLIRWTTAGEPAWRAVHEPGLYWLDCYVLNVGERRAWAVPYTKVPLVEVGLDGIRSVRESPLRRPRGVAVSGAEAVFLSIAEEPGGYYWHLKPARLTEDEVVPEEPVPLALPGGTSLRKPLRWVCRGDRIWLLQGHTWYVLKR
ncbi:hypothetical protein [Amycolatopsis sp. WQ 127309]|uniref:hypothetical protein n=1 Tax=Amycolatopsis sp. WQ 127309 TaxID=2932773 RepID=UPI001FF25C82|nr:hypothetical protein [Amycolatopsis sp. WQ 127309]UOZ10032.1 hypothetical protein MUY22_17860 [Amycolatopsis sp. WQ 127309]